MGEPKSETRSKACPNYFQARTQSTSIVTLVPGVVLVPPVWVMTRSNAWSKG
jgi:hypothetical protein